MKILLLASSPYSHIIQIEPLVRELILKENDVMVMSLKKNKELIESFGVNFIEYPNNIQPASAENTDYNSVIPKYNQLINKKLYKEAIDYFIEEDAKAVFDITDSQLKAMVDIVKKHKIDVIFRDAVDKFGLLLEKILDIPTIGYMTHNLYSKIFFEQSSENLYSIWLDNRNKIPKEYLKGFRNKVDMKFNQLATKYGYKINSYHQLDPLSDLSILFSTEYIQPKESLYSNRQYIYVYPNNYRFNIEKNVSKSLVNFISKYKRIIYISSGTIICQSFAYYKKFIDVLKNISDLGIIISGGDCTYHLNQYKIDNKIHNVMILKNAPQKYILSKSILFITSGGQNSIMESVYFEVPMLVTPLTSEQRLNGYIVQQKKLGLTTNNHESRKKTIGNMMNYLISSKEIHSMLHRASLDIQNHQNNFNIMWQYINNKVHEKKD